MSLSLYSVRRATRQLRRLSNIWLRIGLVLLLVSLLNQASFAQNFPPNFSQQVVANALNNPTVVSFAPDGRIFVAEKGGALRIVKNGSLLPTPFVQLSVNQDGERGLIGITFDPNFIANQYIYLYYTVPVSGSVAVHNRVSRFTANGDVVIGGSELVLLDLEPLGPTNHNGGSMVFGADGKLYIAVGENANSANSQNLDNHLGKVLRLNPDGSTPANNPFTTGTNAKKRIWAYGLRNPYTITVQPGTGRLFVNDVGQDTWEEINNATTGGLNFGWPNVEGVSTNPAYTNPVYAYQHGGGDGVGCAITGGTFYNPTVSRYPVSFVGRYFFQDFCNGWINTLDLSGSTATRSSFVTNLSGQGLSVSTGPDGYVYYVALAGNTLYRIVYAGQDCLTLQNGTWQNATIWSCGREPLAVDNATIRHTVTIGTNTVSSVKQLRYQAGGQVIFSTNSKLRLGL